MIDDELKMLLENTLHKTIKYNDWTEWIWACIGAGVPNTKIHYYSNEGAPDKYNEDECDRIIRCYNKERTTMGLHSLMRWAGENGFEVNRHIIRKAPKFDPKKTIMNWQDLQGKIGGLKTFESKFALICHIRDDVDEVISMIQDGTTFFVVNGSEAKPFNVVEKMSKLHLSYYDGFDDDKKLVKTTLQKIMEENPLDFARFNDIVFKPEDLGVEPKKYEKNTWGGFFAEEVEEVDMELLQPFLNHIKEVIVNNNEDHYDYILSWLAQPIQTPWLPTDAGVIVKGGHGSGKSVVGKVMREYVYGKRLSYATNNLDSIAGQFNEAVMSKIFVHCDELTAIDSNSSYNGLFDRMKNLITDRTIEINIKHGKKFNIDNYINPYFTTNHSFTVSIEKGDRRYVVFETNDKYKGNHKYFERLFDTFKQPNFGNHLFTFFKRFEIKRNVRVLPNTELKKEMTNYNSAEDFLIDCIESDVLTEYRHLLDVSEEHKKFKFKTLYEYYKDWVREYNGGKNLFKQKLFKRIVMPYLTEHNDRKNDLGKQVRCYSLNEEMIIEKLNVDMDSYWIN